MQGINGLSNVQNVTFGKVEKAKAETKLLNKDAPLDSVEISSDKAELSKEQKQEIMQKARTKASGFAILFGPLDTIYYGLRSDKTVAKRFDLDPDKDKKFIKEIKKQQMLWTLPSLIPGLGVIPGIASWLYNKNMDSSKIKVE